MRTSEKETTVEVGSLEAKLFAEYVRSRCEDIYATISCSGWVVTWDNVRHRHGQILLWRDGKYTDDWRVAKKMFRPYFVLELKKEIEKLTENI